MKSVKLFLIRWIKSIQYPALLKKAGVVKTIPKSIGVDGYKQGERNVIVSLTSFPARIKYVHNTICSILNQTMKPNLVILWLSSRQFEKQQLPITLTHLCSRGLTIRWVDEDIKSYKKLIPALTNYPNDIIITADDDLYYPQDWVKNLYSSYLISPNEIHSQLITRIDWNGDTFDSVPRKKEHINTSSYHNKMLGGSGTLYPPHALSPIVLDQDLFMKLSPTSDDLWFWSMALLNDVKIRWIKNNMEELYYVEGMQDNTPCLWKQNDQGERLFIKHLNNLVDYFGLEKKLNET